MGWHSVRNLTLVKRDAEKEMKQGPENVALSNDCKNFEVREIDCEKDINRYIRFTWQVYARNPIWVPPLVEEVKKFLQGKTLFFTHCRHQLFVAEEEGEIVATIAAFYDSNLIDFWKRKIGLVGYFEALPEKRNAVKTLFFKAEEYLKRQGAEYVMGPVNGDIANVTGLLANAYNESPVFLMMYNPSYYHLYFRGSGFRPEQELLAFTVDLMDGKLRRKINFINRKAEVAEVKVRSFERKRFDEDAALLAELYAETFSAHWGYAPQSKEEFYETLATFRLALDYDLIRFAVADGEVIGFVLCVPDYNPVFKKVNGNLDFIGALVLLREKRKITEGRLIAVGVKPKWRGRNVAPLLVGTVYGEMIKKGYIKCEYSWVFRENTPSQILAKKFKGNEYKRYIVYGKHISPN